MKATEMLRQEKRLKLFLQSAQLHMCNVLRMS